MTIDSVDPGSLWQLILRRTSAVLRKPGAAWPQTLAVDVSCPAKTNWFKTPGVKKNSFLPAGRRPGIKTWILMIACVDLLNMFMACGSVQVFYS